MRVLVTLHVEKTVTFPELSGSWRAGRDASLLTVSRKDVSGG